MPFDGTDVTMFENPSLVKLGEVERLLATEQQWCKGRLQDSDGRRCLVGALQAAEARQILEPIVLRAAREVGGKRYWRVEFFNDDPHTTHTDVLRVLRRARENILADMMEAGQRRSWRQRLAQMLRAACSGSAMEAYAALGFATGSSGSGPNGTQPQVLPSAASSLRQHESASAPRELCKVP